ncbi:MAG: ornithine cyclodeaminase family protein [Pseudomonadales bacterium]
MQIPDSVQTFDGAAVRRLLPMALCVDLMAEVQKGLSRGEIPLPLRSFLPLPGEAGRALGVMPGALPERGVFGCKLISLFPENPAAGRPAIQGSVLLFSSDHGAPVALVDAAALTAIRTAAASAAATRALARPDAHVLALVGTGVQAQSHLEAMLCVRSISTVRVWGRTPAHVRAFCASASARYQIPVTAATSIEDAVTGADLVCAVTAAAQPVLRGPCLTPGCHLNLVGAHSAGTREADGAALAGARIFTEVGAFAEAEAGDILLALDEGAIEATQIVGEIGAVLAGALPGRESAADITVYKSLGNVAQDLIAASEVYLRGRNGGA